MFRKMNISFKRKGFVLMPAILSIFILGMLGVSLASIYSDTFSVLTAGKEASQSGSYARIESEYLKSLGYDEAGTGAHNWGSMEKFLGDDEGKQWESKVEKLRHIDISEDNGVDIYRISTRKKGDTAASYSVELPLSSQGSGSGKALGAPDYTRTYRLPQYVSTAPDNGYIIVRLYGGNYSPGDGSGSDPTSFTINGVTPADFRGGDYISSTVTVPVAKNDIIRCTDDNYLFVPCKK